MSNRAADFRWYPASSLGFSFSDNDARIIFGVDDPQGPDANFEQVGVIMTHKTLKLLGQMIQTTIEHYESQTGTIIHLDPKKIDDIRSRLLDVPKPTI